ncbi:MAG: transketolase [Prevotellaceae bacterium]|jgi:transketolase|nr:transketolase [Prevotellaceae bacterium]
MTTIQNLEQIATQVRRDVIRMTADALSGHPGGSLGCADFLTALYFEILQHKPERFTIDGRGQDMFFLSNGHISPIWYSVLARSGYFPVNELSTFRKLGSRLQGHPTNASGLSGVRVASGSLGQGLSVACGAALAKKINGDPHLVYSLHGDGELQEGQIWEAAMFAASKKIDNLISTVDWNNQQIDGTVDSVISLGNLAAKWESFGWTVLHMQGNDMADVLRELGKAKSMTGKAKPVIILMKTEMGQGVDFMQGTNAWHGKVTNSEQTKRALRQLEETLGDY